MAQQMETRTVRQATPERWQRALQRALFAGVVALWPLAALLRRPTSAPRLIVEAFAVTLGSIAAVWIAWLLLWLLEQRY